MQSSSRISFSDCQHRVAKASDYKLDTCVQVQKSQKISAKHTRTIQLPWNRHPGSWTVRKAEVSISQEMLHVSTKGILVCYAFISVKFNGVLLCAGTVKI